MDYERSGNDPDITGRIPGKLPQGLDPVYFQKPVRIALKSCEKKYYRVR